MEYTEFFGYIYYQFKFDNITYYFTCQAKKMIFDVNLDIGKREIIFFGSYPISTTYCSFCQIEMSYSNTRKSHGFSGLDLLAT